MQNSTIIGLDQIRTNMKTNRIYSMMSMDADFALDATRRIVSIRVTVKIASPALLVLTVTIAHVVRSCITQKTATNV